MDSALAAPWDGFAAVEISLVTRPLAPRPLVLSPADAPPEPARPRDLLCMKAIGEPPDDPLVHAAELCYASGLTLLAACVPSSTRDRPGTRPRWTTRCGCTGRGWAERWLLFDQCSPVDVDGRALSTARAFDADGCLVASVSQEGLLRSTP